MIRAFVVVSVAVMAMCFLNAGCTDKDMGSNPSQAMHGDIIAVSSGADMSQLTTFATAVKAAGLTDTLKGPGPYTIFAPTNDAFAKLPAGTLDDLLKPANKEKLRKILLFHVVLGAHDAKELQGTPTLTTQSGQLTLKVNDHRQTVGNSNAMATVTHADIPASNGVIHLVDTVLMP